MRVAARLLWSAALLALASAALAVEVEPPPAGVGAPFVPGVRVPADLPQAIVEEEFLVSGTASLYSYASDPPAGPTDLVLVESDVPYRTRIIVRRPADPGDFNGSVVLEWWNSTAGFDAAPVWDVSAEYFARRGFIYVGFTNANQALGFLTGGCSLFGVLPPTCGTRYATLSLPDDGLAYEIASQIASLLQSDAPENPIPAAYEVERLYQAAQSQQAGSLVTYASGFHTPGVDHGYFIQANIFARPINGGRACGAGVPPFPDCTPRLEGADRYVRSDLPVPVVQALGETDVVFLWGTGGRQPDTPTYRYYEMAASAHLTVHEGIEVLPGLEFVDLCAAPLNSSADGPIHGGFLMNAMWENLEQQVRRGTAPPAGRVLALDADGVVLRDAFGNALGGVRVPDMDVPIARYAPPRNRADPTLPPFLQAIGNLACFLGGSVLSFDAATLAALYPTHDHYVGAYRSAAKALVGERLLLREDASTLVRAAAARPIGACGIGFELVLVLLPLYAARRIRASRARR